MKYTQYFGLLKEEVETLVKQTRKFTTDELTQIKNWYNGYHIGEHWVYNPWSIINCLDQDLNVQPYWVNTSSNRLIGKLMMEAKPDLKQGLETLLQGQPLTVQFADRYQIKSNRESGLGRYDVMMIPKDKSQQGIIFEFKSAEADVNKETMTRLAQEALQQIKDKQYAAELQQAGIQTSLALGLVFSHKQVIAASEHLSA